MDVNIGWLCLLRRLGLLESYRSLLLNAWKFWLCGFQQIDKEDEIRKISLFVFRRWTNVSWVWNNIRVSKWQHNYHFGSLKRLITCVVFVDLHPAVTIKNWSLIFQNCLLKTHYHSARVMWEVARACYAVPEVFWWLLCGCSVVQVKTKAHPQVSVIFCSL